jgi:hypothetical protein
MSRKDPKRTKVLDAKIVAAVVTQHGLSKQVAAAVVRQVLQEAADDIRRCLSSIADPEIALGVRIAAARLEFAETRCH